MGNFFTVLAYLVGIPCTVITILKIYAGITERVYYGGIGWFLVSSICWAWIFR